MVEGWAVGLAANGVIATAYLAVAVLLGVNAVRTRQWRTNTLGVMTAIIFVFCGGGHAVHTLQLIDVAMGSASAAAVGARIEYQSWSMIGIDLVTAGVGITYWLMRKRFPHLVTGTAVFEDLRLRQRRALEINDNIVQGLARAKLSLELHRDEEARHALDETALAGHKLLDDITPHKRGAS